jgi:hypothetical protein
MAEKKWLTEDKLALTLGLILFGLSLLNFGGIDPLGWAVKTNVGWMRRKCSRPHGRLQGASGIASLILTWVFVTACWPLASRPWAAIPAVQCHFSLVFFISIYAMPWALATIAATPNIAKFNLKWPWPTGEAGFIVACWPAFSGNFMPGLAAKLKTPLSPRVRQDRIVILGADWSHVRGRPGSCPAVIFRALRHCRGLPIYWALVLHLPEILQFPEWAATLGSGISICGYPRPRTGGAIRARAHRPNHGFFPGRGVYLCGDADPALCGPALDVWRAHGGRA